MGDTSSSRGRLWEGRIGDREEVPGPPGVSGDERGLALSSIMLGAAKSSSKGVRVLLLSIAVKLNLGSKMFEAEKTSGFCIKRACMVAREDSGSLSKGAASMARRGEANFRGGMIT